jgi:predicted RNase H-like HicB family nuclease
VTATQHDYRGYVFRIDYQAAEPAYTVEFADFPEIITSGSTLAEAFANACEALDLHLESVQKLQMPVPEPKHALRLQRTE